MDIATMSDKELRIFIKGYEEAIRYLSNDSFWALRRVRGYESTFNLCDISAHLFPEKVTYDLLNTYKGKLEADLEELKKEASKRFETEF